ncbi:O-antigen ligase domain-containing protein [Tardiphaga alba]|uniref:O-antigen ligase domain-containing protein n=1 Tax=Tardiphaga alba TaxID=340268 RepID=A0ABX8A7G8_9BRAD|nr:O-antigen ligase family protein [Tardiphaga alba]QUS39594.1 O-antigen ligase domain-containing protein [Tardiphaga alba]
MNQARLRSGLLAFVFAGWLTTVLLLAGTLAAGPVLGGLSRPLFVIGCAGVGWLAWRHSAAAHVQSAIVLFAFTPFVRRVVDLTVGFDQSSVMLIGPLLFVLTPLPSLWTWLSQVGRPRNPWVVGPFVVLACLAYGTALTMFQNDWMAAATGTLKWGAPVLYGIALQQRARSDGELVNAMAGAFFVVLPITGLYGIWQYVDPPNWDRFWMNYASITSAGFPLPYMVRVFSTMNGPATYATFTATGMLLLGFLRPGWQSLFALAPAAIGLLLSLYRAGWLALAVGVLFCMFFSATRFRAITTGVGIAVAAVCAVLFTPFGDVITTRLQSLGSGSEDGSGAERLEEFVTLWNMPDAMVWGTGFTFSDVGVAGAMPIDGQIISSWLTFGIPVGLISLAAYLWVATWSVSAAWRMPTREGVVLGAIAFGGIILHVPLTSIASGEISVLFWMIFAMACPWDLVVQSPVPRAVPQEA